MNNQFGRNQCMSHEEASLLELKTVLEGVFAGTQREEQRSLLAILNHLQKMLIKRFSENPPLIAPKDYNLSSAIYEKCLRIKEQSQQLKMRALDLRASLGKMIVHAQSPEIKRAYTEMIDNIRRKGADVRSKIEKCRGRGQTAAPRLASSDLLRSRGVVELKKAAEWLQRKALEQRREVDVWKDYCSSQSYRD